MDDLLRTLDALREFDEADARGAERVAVRRRSWTEHVERLALDTFAEVASAAKASRGLVSRPPHGADNWRSVQLAFGVVGAGVVRRFGDGGMEAATETGAAIVLGQSVTGRIAVVFYPFRATIGDEPLMTADPLVATMVEPEEVTRGFVLDWTAQFFEWASTESFRTTADTDRERIGFSRPLTGEDLEPS